MTFDHAARQVVGSNDTTINSSAVDTGELIEVANPGGKTGNVTVEMGGSETLLFDNPSAFVGSISGFASADIIDLNGIAPGQVTFSSDDDVLSIDPLTFDAVNLQLSPGDYTGDVFQASSDGNGGTDITVNKLEITPDNPTVSSASGSESSTLTRSGDTSQAETVYVSTTDGTTVRTESTNTGDFAPLSYQPVTFAAGDASASFDVTLLGGGSKTFGVEVTDGTSTASAVLAADQFTLSPLPAAVPQIQLLGGLGTWSVSGNTYTLNLGDVIQSDLAIPSYFAVVNAADSPSQKLSGNFAVQGDGQFNTSGTEYFSGVPAGSTAEIIEVDSLTSAPGQHTKTITLTPSSDDVDGSTPLAPITLVVTDFVGPPYVPHPTWEDGQNREQESRPRISRRRRRRLLSDIAVLAIAGIGVRVQIFPAM